MKREGGGAEGGRLQAEDAASEAGLASCGRAYTENDGERERGPRCGLVLVRQRAWERPQMAALSCGQKVHKIVLNREFTSHFK